MSRSLYHLIFVPLFMMGLFHGIYLDTGVKADPESLTLQVGDEIAEATGQDSIWSTFKLLIVIVSAMVFVLEIFAIIAAGWPSIIVAVAGYLSGLFMGSGVFITFAAVLLIIAELIALWAPDPY